MQTLIRKGLELVQQTL